MFFKKKEVKEEDILLKRIEELYKKVNAIGECEHTGFVVRNHGDITEGYTVKIYTNLGWRYFTLFNILPFTEMYMFEPLDSETPNDFNFRNYKDLIFQITYLDGQLTIKPMLGVKLSAKDIDLAILELERTVEMYYSHHKNMLEIHNKEVEKLQRGEW